MKTINNHVIPTDTVALILASEKFQSLVKQRNRTRFFLTFLVLALHAFFVGGIAFYPKWFSHPIADGSGITVGIVATVAVIVSMVLIEVVYIWISKKVFSPLQAQVVAEVNAHE